MSDERDEATGDTLRAGSYDETLPPESAPIATVRGAALAPRGRPSAQAPAQAVDGRYELGELLGRGGMGEVVLAYDEQIGREVAIKRIRAEQPSADELARFWREARLQGRLEHPAVVPVHDLAIDREGRPFFVMKRLSGTTMHELLGGLRAGEGAATQLPAPSTASASTALHVSAVDAALGAGAAASAGARGADGAPGSGGSRDSGDSGEVALLRRRLLRAFVDVCLAVEFAHARGVVHRDLKPANIMLGDFGEVYVLDWGIARAVTEADDSGAVARPSLADLKLETGDTAAGTIMGTPVYAAPEQLLGERAGPTADVYSLGCILYEIVSGELLHPHRDLSSLATAVDARPSQRRADAPPELDAVCVAATVLEPARRLRSARSLGDAVQAFLDGDRDVAVRKELAALHLRAARDALAAGSHANEARRRNAMREAGRALALDPTDPSAAEIVTHLLLSPPDVAPPEVDAAIEAHDVRTARAQGRLAARSLYAYLAFVPLLLWTGVREPWIVIALLASALASSMQLWIQIRGEAIRPGAIYANAAINAVLLAFVVRVASPFLIAPPIALTMMIGYAAHPRFGRTVWIAMILAAGIAVPWALEAAHVLSPTYAFEDGRLVLSSRVIQFTSAPIQLACGLITVALLAVVGVLSRDISRRQRQAGARLELQAWHLRQILPSEPATGAATADRV